MIDGKGLIHPWEKLDWVIDFNDMSIEEASNYKLPFERVKEKVKPERDKSREKNKTSKMVAIWKKSLYYAKPIKRFKLLFCYS